MEKHNAAMGQIRTGEVALGIALTATSGAAILAHVFGSVPMTLTVPFLAMPSIALVVAGVLLRGKLYRRFRVVADLVRLGAWTGLVSTLAYDIIRPVIELLFRFKFNPFEAMPIFGHLITGLPAKHPASLVAGWTYHLWNGTSFGMMFALFWPRGGALAGLLWGLGLQCLMLMTYPHLLKVRLDDPGFLVTGLTGHALWGLVLGSSIAKWGTYA